MKMKSAIIAALIGSAVAFALNTFMNVETLAILAFAWEGLVSITVPSLSTIIFGGSQVKYPRASMQKGCYREHPWLLQKLVNLTESSLENDNSHCRSTPVRELEFSEGQAPHSCKETLWNTKGGRLAPFIVRGGRGMARFTEFSPAWLLQHFGNTSVMAMDMREFGDSIDDISRCPQKRKTLLRNVPLKDMAEDTGLYAGFNQEALDAIYNQIYSGQSKFISFVDDTLHNMCNAFNGMDGELFFGWTSSSKASVSGTGFHCAAMENIFLQVHGERNWTLVDPRYTMRMRPMHGAHYMSGAGLYEQGWNTLQRPAHWDSIPKLTVTTRPGDILFIPTWWWHEIRIEKSGFSLGISNRNSWIDQPLREKPMVRFVPGVLSKISTGAGLVPFLMDAIHLAPTLLVCLLYQTGIISNMNVLMTVQQTQHETKYP